MKHEDYAKHAHAVAVLLAEADVRGADGCVVLAMAMGFYLECQPGTHRDMLPLAEALNTEAVRVFDRMREARLSGWLGNA